MSRILGSPVILRKLPQDGEVKVGVDDYAKSHSWKQFEGLETVDPFPPSLDGLIVVNDGTVLHQQVEKAHEALIAAAADERLFIYGERIARITKSDINDDLIKEDSRGAATESATSHFLEMALSRTGKVCKKNKLGEIVAAHPRS